MDTIVDEALRLAAAGDEIGLYLYRPAIDAEIEALAAACAWILDHTDQFSSPEAAKDKLSRVVWNEVQLRRIRDIDRLYL